MSPTAIDNAVAAGAQFNPLNAISHCTYATVVHVAGAGVWPVHTSLFATQLAYENRVFPLLPNYEIRAILAELAAIQEKCDGSS
jgi:pyridoxal/pyridoxine/pyridoxamine kinase